MFRILIALCLSVLIFSGSGCDKDKGVEAKPAVAIFLSDPAEGVAPLEVEFTDESEGDIEEWFWDFGDGGTSTEQHPLHTYNAAGMYTVSLTVKGLGGENTTNGYIEVDPLISSVIINLRFSGPRYAGTFYTGFLPATDHAVWIEDAEGQYLKTLGISKTAVSVAQYSHVDHLPTWMTKSGTTYEALQAETGEGVAPSFDAVSGASVYFLGDVTDSTLVFEWDLKDGEGNRVLEENFRFCAEVANITKDVVTAYQINAEAASGLMDLKEQSTTPADPTEHILALSSEYRYAE